MQTSGNRSSFYRPVSSWTSRVAGMGLAVGLLFAASVAGTSCSPGTLPPDFQPVVGSGGTAPTGGTGGTSGSGGGNPTGGMGGMAGSVTRDTKVASCSKFKTLGESDDYLKMRCGAGKGACHSTGAVWTNMDGPDTWKTFLMKNATLSCGGAKLIDSADWMNSLIVIKTSQAMPKCPGAQAIPGDLMPSKLADPMQVALSADEVTCFQQLAKAASGN
jgi:hypothetical protein